MVLKSTDFTGAILDLAQLSQMFGDASTVLPHNMSRPCHWSDQDLPIHDSYWLFQPPPDDPFIGHWRGWVEANGGTWPTSPLFGNFKDVIAIPPPPECPLIKDM